MTKAALIEALADYPDDIEINVVNQVGDSVKPVVRFYPDEGPAYPAFIILSAY